MARGFLENQYELDNANTRISTDDVKKSLRDFEYFAANYMQVITKEGKAKPWVLNGAQKYLYKSLWPMIAPATRLDRHREVIVVKARQLGISTFVFGFMNYVNGFAEGIERLNSIHILPTTDTIDKLTMAKVEPVLTGVHPDLQPNIVHQKLGSSHIYTYKDIIGFPRNNSYEFISANASSIRGSTIHVALYDEVAYYRDPYGLVDMVAPSQPDTGFSLSVYFSTYGDKQSDFFMQKIRTAMDNPDEMDLIFIPWFMNYPEVPLYGAFNEEELNEYETTVILPALRAYGIPREQWGDKLLWYRRKSLQGVNMKREFPTTLDEVLAMGENQKVFKRESLEHQEQFIEAGQPVSLAVDTLSKEVKVLPDDGSSFIIYRKPEYKHTYIMTVDPILTQGENTDYFAMSIFDNRTFEQVATYRDRGLPVEDYSSICVAAAKYYNRAIICPEKNAADAFLLCLRNLQYYNLWYSDARARARKDPGIRTTATSKVSMIEKLGIMLDQHKVVLHDRIWLEELGRYERMVKKRSDGGQTIKLSAPSHQHDDTVATMFLLAGCMDERQLLGTKRPTYGVLW